MDTHNHELFESIALNIIKRAAHQAHDSAAFDACCELYMAEVRGRYVDRYDGDEEQYLRRCETIFMQIWNFESLALGKPETPVTRFRNLAPTLWGHDDDNPID
jgi:hypothetical protein